MSIHDGNLKWAAEEDETLCEFRQIGDSEFPKYALDYLPRLRRNFKHQFDVDLFYLVPEAEEDEVYFYVEAERHSSVEIDSMYYWIRGFLAQSNPIPATFVAGPEEEKDVHTEHCCVDHGCKYGADDCPVEHGKKKQSFPCHFCDGAENTWGL